MRGERREQSVLHGIAQWAHDRRFTWASNKREDFSVPNEAGGKSTVGMERCIAFKRNLPALQGLGLPALALSVWTGLPNPALLPQALY